MATHQFSITIPHWPVYEMTGYKPFTTFWADFSIADKFGPAAIKDTFKRAFNEWKGNYKYLTELSMVLNHKIASHYSPNKEAPNVLAKLYSQLWEQVDSYAYQTLQGEELDYYYSITD